MDQVKIGKFIAECRKSKSLTQMQLAEKLNITDRAVSKWETGKGMPDSSIMLDLCNELDISVNELLSGERIEMDNYNEKAEENFIGLRQSSERIERKLQNILTAFKVLSIILSAGAIAAFIAHLVMNYLGIENYNGELYRILLPILITLTFTFCIIAFIINFREKYEIVEKKQV